MKPNIEAIRAYVDANRESLFQILEELVRRPSENRSPMGEEAECQRYLALRLSKSGYEVDLYSPDDVDGMRDHPLRTPDRGYPQRKNLAVRRRGVGGGRSLLLSGHIDTVPRGTLPWTREAFVASREGNRLYGRGANDMKAGIAINLFVLEALDRLRVPLRGDVFLESVVDEEFGGVNGTLAGRLRGYIAEAAILTEPSSLRICAGQRGGRTVHLCFSANGGVLGGMQGVGVIAQMMHFLNALPSFTRLRKERSQVHPLYAACEDPVPVTVTKVTTGPWGTSEPITVPEECRVELYWQLMPGERQEDVDREFEHWLRDVVESAPEVFAAMPHVSAAVRWLPGSAISANTPLCQELSAAAEMALGHKPLIVGIEGPCDLFVFHEFGIPAVLWGPSGGNTHGSDEYVDLDSMVDAATSLISFAYDWCGVAE